MLEYIYSRSCYNISKLKTIYIILENYYIFLVAKIILQVLYFVRVYWVDLITNWGLNYWNFWVVYEFINTFTFLITFNNSIHLYIKMKNYSENKQIKNWIKPGQPYWKFNKLWWLKYAEILIKSKYYKICPSKGKKFNEKFYLTLNVMYSLEY